MQIVMERREAVMKPDIDVRRMDGMRTCSPCNDKCKKDSQLSMVTEVSDDKFRAKREEVCQTSASCCRTRGAGTSRAATTAINFELKWR